MSYLEKSLVAGEKVVYRARLHWIVFMIPAIFLLLSIAALVGSRYQSWAIYLAAGLFGVSLITGVRSAIARSSSEFAVTNKRVIFKVGFMTSHSVELLLSKVEGITVDQDMFGNIFNYGTIGVKGTGGTQEKFEKIGNPFEFRRRTQEQIVAGQDTTVHWGPQMRG